MINVENLLEPIAIEALISEVYNYSSWEHMYTLSDRNFFIEKQVIKNYIQVWK